MTHVYVVWSFLNQELDTPRQTEVRDVTDTYAVISWSPPVANIDAITLSFGPTSDPSNRKSVDLPPTDTQHTADGLSPDTEYEVTLVSRRGDMTSDPASDTFTTGRDMEIHCIVKLFMGCISLCCLLFRAGQLIEKS